MRDLATPYLHIKRALGTVDIETLREACKRYISREGIPCYVSINDLECPTYLKIKQVVEQQVGEALFYLNDFYMYTDRTFRTSWHVDTELYAFDCAVNAWVLLAPEVVEDPLGFIRSVNESSERIFHSVRVEGDRYVFGDYSTGETMARPVVTVEAEQVHTPRIEVGDILVINPRRFHRTNVDSPKHAMAFKFVMNGRNGFLSSNQVDPELWPEVGVFNRLVNNASTWDGVVQGIRHALATETGRKELCAGFYPGKFDLYRRMVQAL